MEIIISDEYERFRHEIGISVKDIKTTIQSPDKSFFLNLNQLEKNLVGFSKGRNVVAGFYLKELLVREDIFYTLVITRQPEKQTIFVHSAFLINKKIIPQIDVFDPYEVLKKFIELFGIDIKFGKKTYRFIEAENIKIEDFKRTPFLKVKAPKDSPVISIQYIKIINNGKNVLCALAYAINIKTYLDWLNTQRKYRFIESDYKIASEDDIKNYYRTFKEYYDAVLKDNINYQVKAIVSNTYGSLLYIEFSEKPNAFEFLETNNTINEELSKLPQNSLSGDISNIWFADTNIIREKNKLIIIKGDNYSESWSINEAIKDVNNEIQNLKRILSKGDVQ